MGNPIEFKYRRLYYEVSLKVLQSDNKSYYYLTYLKLQNHCSKHGGYFSVSNVQEILNCSERTANKHISQIINLGYVSIIDINYYKINSQKSLTSSYKKQYYVTKDIDLYKYSYKNISEFRALLMLMVDKKHESTKQYLIKKNQSRPTKGKYSKKQESDTISGYYNKIACTISAFNCNKSNATISRWRKKQSLVTYTSFKEEVKEDLSSLSICEINDLNPLNKLGKYYIHRGHVMFSSVSEVSFNGFCLKRYR